MSLTYSQLNQLNLIKLRVSYVCSSCFLFRPSSKNILLLLAIQEYDIVPLIYISFLKTLQIIIFFVYGFLLHAV